MSDMPLPAQRMRDVQDWELRAWYGPGSRSGSGTAYARETMRAPRKDQLGWVLRGFRAGVRSVHVDPEDYAGLVQRLGAAGALSVEGIKRCLELGGIDLGGFGPVRRFEFVAKGSEDLEAARTAAWSEMAAAGDAIQEEWEKFRRKQAAGARW